jgi:hypothetical protein
MLGKGARSIGAGDEDGLVRPLGDWPLRTHANIEERRNAHPMTFHLQFSLQLLSIWLRPGNDEMHVSQSTKCPPLRFTSSPASLPMASASAGSPSRVAVKTSIPSGVKVSPLKCSRPFLICAYPAIGVLHEPSSSLRKARSQAIAIAVVLSLI